MKIIMKMPAGKIYARYDGNAVADTVEHAYFGDAKVEGGFFVIDSDAQYAKEFKSVLLRRGYTLILEELFCSECRKDFKDINELNIHILEVHPQKEVDIKVDTNYNAKKYWVKKKDGWYCTLCEHKSFSKEKYAKSHYTRYHSLDIKNKEVL